MSEALLRERVCETAGRGEKLRIRGGGTKDFYGREPSGEILDVSGHTGIVSYEPTELVITARAGTPLQEVVDTLAAAGQMLPFDPPRFAPGGSIGGAVASGLAGPRRPWGGAPRDLLLGVKLLDGKGQILNFGGQVMKNVAGYDVSRLMAGSMGTLGVLLEVSVKVLPRPKEEHTLVRESSAAEAIDLFAKLQQRPLPLTGAAHRDGSLYLRMAAGKASVERLAGEIGAETGAGGDFWNRLRDHQSTFFQGPRPLWRLSVPPAWKADTDLGETFIDWGGAQRWIKTDAPALTLRTAAEAAGGHATAFRNGDRSGEIFHPLSAPVRALQDRLTRVFDPTGLFDRGRLYPRTL